MEQKIRFEKIESLLKILEESKVTGNLNFKEMDTKLELKEVYQSIYGSVAVDLSCATCVNFYLNMLQAWYEREFPRYQSATVNEEIKTDEAKTSVEEIILPTPKKRNKRN